MKAELGRIYRMQNAKIIFQCRRQLEITLIYSRKILQWLFTHRSVKLHAGKARKHPFGFRKVISKLSQIFVQASFAIFIKIWIIRKSPLAPFAKYER